MKKIILLFLTLLIGNINVSKADDCEQRIYRQCLIQEASNSDDSRGGMSKEEFCSYVAVSECRTGRS